MTELERFQKSRETLNELSGILKCNHDSILDKVEKIVDYNEELNNEKTKLLKSLGRL